MFLEYLAEGCLAIVAQSHYKKGLLRYNEVCELRMGASSNGIGVGLYLTLK
jgi:hypothetical protein